MVRHETVRDMDLSIRFKYGSHTIFLFVDPMATFSHIQEQLLDALKERYPDGITSRSKTTELPSNASQIKFAMLKDKTDPTQGWKPLTFEFDEAPADKGFQDNMMVAFAIAPDDADDTDDIEFDVIFPSFDEVEDEGDL
ncbi:hypothetical protein NUW58_g8591 [Xylaria curta]|uniref:Uncharacterized protein n=1 Tax=Xylaria curta TaxID=42375 RepID=A0ACC1N5T3_9PEZI|nr:hypothetical protein NUW58_g8591 [Xylaria curta]